MNPHLDQVLVGLLVATALGSFIWRALRKKSGSSCGGGCGCAPKPPAVRPPVS